MVIRTVINSAFQTIGEALSKHSFIGIDDRYDLERRYAGKANLWYYGEGQEYYFELPENAPPRFRRFEGRQSYPPSSITAVTDVCLIGSKPIPISNRSIIVEAIVRPRILQLHLVESLQSLRPSIIKRDQSFDTALLLYNSWNKGYFHWIAENLTRLQAAEYYEQRTGERPTIIVGPELSAWQRESLNLLGWRECDRVRWEGDHAQVDTLIVPSNPRKLHTSWRWVSERMKSNILDKPKTQAKRIYVSRTDADQRRVVNESDLMNLLSSYGFEKVIPSELSVKEQVLLFATADIVVGPHGAGLTNLIHGEPPLTLIELFSSDDVRDQYFNMATKLRYDYEFVLGNPVGNDMRIQPEKVEEILEDVL